ncbi:ADP-ribosylglycohydrolase family protein [Actinocorallia populi]|uniref:ADP-ribosylglycohydrolase family protein n=1 Tax=Actinocorallia populi TaxID=2079200 RepID=UPI000D090B04|nr:ADP-ribosylglycohydrolase family protein [Actinocorallia populi]
MHPQPVDFLDLERAFSSLLGLSVGDAFGDRFFAPVYFHSRHAHTVPEAPWAWSDDTEMACTVTLHLAENHRVDQDLLAAEFAARLSVGRRYGANALELLERVRAGAGWRTEARAGFGGEGSYGNGAAMRVAPLGAALTGRPEEAAGTAIRTAEVTHAHPEAVQGAAAVAAAAAAAPAGMFGAVLGLLPEGRMRERVSTASAMGDAAPERAAAVLGNGERISALDTVPFCLWTVGRYGADYTRALRACVAVGGDMDTTAAIVGGIIAAHHGHGVIPATWLEAREPLPEWLSLRAFQPDARSAEPRDHDRARRPPDP